jgi:hypothetical protein
MSHCTGAFAVYSTEESCRAVCATLPPGAPGDQTGDTAHCRLGNAASALAEPSYYCPLSAPVCTGEDAPWPTFEACVTECAALPDLGTYTVDGEAGLYAGPHVQCRLFHLAVAAVEDAAAHCPHVGGAPPCAETDGP